MKINNIDMDSIFTSSYIKPEEKNVSEIKENVFVEDSPVYPFVENMDFHNYDNSTDYSKYPIKSKMYLTQSLSYGNYEVVKTFDLAKLKASAVQIMETGFRRGSIYDIKTIKWNASIHDLYGGHNNNTVIIERVGNTTSDLDVAIYKIIQREAVSDNATSLTLELDVWATFNDRLATAKDKFKLVRGHFPMARFSLDDYLEDPFLRHHHFDTVEGLGGSKDTYRNTIGYSIPNNGGTFHVMTFECDFVNSYNSTNSQIIWRHHYNTKYIAVKTEDFGQFTTDLINLHPQIYRTIKDIRVVPDTWVDTSFPRSYQGTEFYEIDLNAEQFEGSDEFRIIWNFPIDTDTLKVYIKKALNSFGSEYYWMQKFYTKEHLKIVVDLPFNNSKQEVYLEDLFSENGQIYVPIQLSRDPGSLTVDGAFWRIVSAIMKGDGTLSANAHWNGNSAPFDYPYERVIIESGVDYNADMHFTNIQRRNEIELIYDNTVARNIQNKDNIYATALNDKTNSNNATSTGRANTNASILTTKTNDLNTALNDKTNANLQSNATYQNNATGADAAYAIGANNIEAASDATGKNMQYADEMNTINNESITAQYNASSRLIAESSMAEVTEAYYSTTVMNNSSVGSAVGASVANMFGNGQAVSGGTSGLGLSLSGVAQNNASFAIGVNTQAQILSAQGVYNLANHDNAITANDGQLASQKDNANFLLAISSNASEYANVTNRDTTKAMALLTDTTNDTTIGNTYTAATENINLTYNTDYDNALANYNLQNGIADNNYNNTTTIATENYALDNSIAASERLIALEGINNEIIQSNYDKPVIIKETNKRSVVRNGDIDFSINLSVVTDNNGSMRRAAEEYRTYGYRCNEVISELDYAIDGTYWNIPDLVDNWLVSESTFWQFDINAYEIGNEFFDIPDQINEKILQIMTKGFHVKQGENSTNSNYAFPTNNEPHDYASHVQTKKNNTEEI